MKRVVLFCLLVAVFNNASANHLMGGCIQYKYVGPGSAANSSKYQVTVFVYINCITGPGVPTEDNAVVRVFDAVDSTSVMTVKLPHSHAGGGLIEKTTFDRCITTPPAVCYLVYPFSDTIELPNNPHGYILAAVNIYRTTGIINVQNSGTDAVMNEAIIPGTINGVDYHAVSSPSFIFQDTVVICHGNPFTYQFNAVDPDGDTLTYAFGNGLDGAGEGSPGASGGDAPPYGLEYFFPIRYTDGFSGTSPLGPGVTINRAKGIISGTAPDKVGPYEVVVYVSKWRNGIVVTTTKKELQITVADCGLAAAQLKPEYLNCNDYTFFFQNESTSSSITTYRWTFGAPGDGRDTSTEARPAYTYRDTGTYTLKLVTYNKIGCPDSASATVKVYPGFKPGFTVDGNCYQGAFMFTDTTFARYGSVNGWLWDFGDLSTTTDTSTMQNPAWLYSGPGTKTVSLFATSTKGCSDYAYKTINVRDQPAIYLPFTDTLICSNDTLALLAQGGTIAGWGPAYNISDTTIANPKVYPDDTTVYTVTVKDKGCIGTATVTVNVLPYITVSLRQDTAICKTDSILLSPTSYALNYAWTETNSASTLSGTGVKYPKAAPPVTTTYSVTANLGHCQANATQTVYVSPYPAVALGNDTGICYGNQVRLQATTTAAYYTWSPVSTLSQANTLSPLAQPGATTTYLLTVSDTLYCPKTVTDSVTVTVVLPFAVNAGRDTTVVIGEPLQLLATSANSAASYIWSPVAYLNNPYVYNPATNFTAATPDSIVYMVTATTPQGCYATDYVTVKVYKTAPQIFVPGAFTPNGDGTNDVLKPILAGITEFNYFRVFNRFGQCVFQTSRPGNGWDGSLKGQYQPPGTYVFMARGKDYLGNVIARKGTVVLIR